MLGFSATLFILFPAGLVLSLFLGQVLELLPDGLNLLLMFVGLGLLLLVGFGRLGLLYFQLTDLLQRGIAAAQDFLSFDRHVGILGLVCAERFVDQPSQVRNDVLQLTFGHTGLYRRLEFIEDS